MQLDQLDILCVSQLAAAFGLCLALLLERVTSDQAEDVARTETAQCMPMDRLRGTASRRVLVSMPVIAPGSERYRMWVRELDSRVTFAELKDRFG